MRSHGGVSEPVLELTAQQLRALQVSEYTSWLRRQTSKHKRPFQEKTIHDYAETARALDWWLTSRSVDGDFTACDTAMLNSFFLDYLESHGQGGTNTRQRSLCFGLAYTWANDRAGQVLPSGRSHGLTFTAHASGHRPPAAAEARRARHEAIAR